MSTTYTDNVTIRLSRGDDEHAVAALAQLVTVPRRRWLRRKSAGSVAPLVAQ